MPRTACPNFWLSHRFARRDVLRAGGLSLLGLTLPELLAARAAEPAVASISGGLPVSSFGQAKACILLFMWGGPAQQDTWDLKPQAPAEVRGTFQPIATKIPDIRICEHFPLLSQRTNKLAIIRSMTHNNVDHTVVTHFLLTGMPPSPEHARTRGHPKPRGCLGRMGGFWQFRAPTS